MLLSILLAGLVKQRAGQGAGPEEEAYLVEDANGVVETIPAGDIISDKDDSQQPIMVHSPFYIYHKQEIFAG